MLNKLSFHGFRNSLGTVIYPQLIEDMSQFLLNGGLTDAELGTNVIADQSGRDHMLAFCNDQGEVEKLVGGVGLG